MSNIKISQLAIGTVSSTVYLSAIDTSLSAGSQNVKISATSLQSSGGATITLSGTPVASFNPSNFTLSNGVVSVIQPTIPAQPTLSGTPITTFNTSSFSQANGTLSVISSGGSTITLSGVAVTSFDPTTFTSTNGTVTVNETAFTALSTATSLTAGTQILVVSSGVAYSATLSQLAAEILTLNAPAITISTIGNQVTNNSFSIAGTLANYANPPILYYEDNAGSFSLLPSGTISNTAFSFTHPGLATGTYTVSVRDGNGVLGTSASFNVALALATAATISGAPTVGVAGSAISGETITLTPSNATGYIVLNTGGTDQGSRQAFLQSSVPALTPLSAGTYTIVVYANPTGGTALATSPSITVSATAATAATIGTVSSTAITGNAITGITDTLTPSNASAYAVLSLGGTDEGTRQAFTGTTLPSLTPQSTGSYTIKIYAASTGGSALATSTAITVTLPVATAATIATAPSTGTTGQAIVYTNTLTPSNAGAYAALFLSGSQEGSRIAITGTTFSLTPASIGSYTAEIFAASTGGSALATSTATTVTAVATAATISGAPGTGTAGTAITGVTDTLTPSNATAYAVLNNGTDQGSRQAFTGTSIPSLTPSAAGTYTIKIYAAITGGPALATSASITVAAAPLVVPQINSTSPIMHLDSSVTSSVTSDAAFATPQTTNGGAVKGWIDQTTNHYSFSQSTTTSSLVTNAKNGLNGILLSKNDQLSGPLALATAIQAIVKGSSGGVTFAFVGLVADITRLVTVFGMQSTTQVFAVSAGGDPGLYVEGTNNFIGTALTYQRIICTVNAAAKTYSIAFNGGNFQTQAYTIASDTAASAAPYIGAAYAQATDITLLEEVVWPALAQQSDVTAIDTYLLNKWGS